MSQQLTPQHGYNNNVRHRGRVFHIQTEDSGVRRPKVITHLFADGGRIIQTARRDYTEHLDEADLPARVRALMREQHKAMFLALRSGELDGAIQEVCGPLQASLSDMPPDGSEAEVARTSSDAAESREARSTAPSPACGGDLVTDLPRPPPKPRVPRTVVTEPVRSREHVSPSAGGRYASTRPPAFMADAPPGHGSIFGGSGDERLDDVILTYLSEEEASP